MAERYILKNGLRLLLEYMPHLRSVATGVWIDTGSARESAGQYGVAHLLEHMMFKGTETRSARQISAALDDVGGVLNAFTSKESTCFYTRALDEHFELGLSLLADMYHHSRFDAADTEREKQVVIEEINMYADTPDELVGELFAETICPGHPYGRSISGKVEDVAQLSHADVRAFWQRYYHAAGTVLAVAGNVESERAIALAEQYFSPEKGQAPAALSQPTYATGDAFIEKDIEQNHICLGFSGPALIEEKDYYAAAIINSAFGGTASARLFQEVREKRGLSYSAYSYLDSYLHSGTFMAYASTQPGRTDELIEVMANEFAQLASQGVTEEEIQRAKDQLKGAIYLGMESSGGVMTRIGKTELTHQRVYAPDEIVAKLLAVTKADTDRMIRQMVQPGRLVLAQVGPKQTQLRAAGLF